MSKTNEIIYLENLFPDKKQLFRLFLTTGWNEEYQLDEDKLFNAAKHSWYMVSAYDNDILTGFGRIISDGILHALIVDMIVLPEYQGKGIGKAILEKLLDKCKSHNICDVQLFCAKGKVGFYKSSGFTERPLDAPGMQFKNRWTV